MRLIHYDEHGELGLTPDLLEDVPPYAILSHTWDLEKDEVSFQDMQSNAWTRKKGREKLDFCVERAKKDRLRYFWIDTCCINKSDKMEVLDAIMSMFRWYANSEVCYVYMSDVTVDANNPCAGDDTWKTDFHAAKWFTRGWCLQELLAPKFVRFFSREGRDLGTKVLLLEDIHKVTTIPRRALCGTPLSEFSAAERMRWAAHRQTTKAEDRAYCLTGILGIFIVFHYGERSMLTIA